MDLEQNGGKVQSADMIRYDFILRPQYKDLLNRFVLASQTDIV